MKFLKFFVSIILITALFAISGCIPKKQEVEGKISVGINISELKAKGYGVASVTIKLKNGDREIIRELTVNGDTATTTITGVPVGTWQVIVEVKNDQGLVELTGTGEVIVQPNGITPVIVTLEPNPDTTGSVQLTIETGGVPVKVPRPTIFCQSSSNITANNQLEFYPVPQIDIDVKDPSSITACKVYRSTNIDGPYSFVCTAIYNGGSWFYAHDKTVTEKGIYYYRITLLSKDNKESAMSDYVTIKIFDAPVYVSPQNNSEFFDTDPLFSWQYPYDANVIRPVIFKKNEQGWYEKFVAIYFQTGYMMPENNSFKISQLISEYVFPHDVKSFPPGEYLYYIPMVNRTNDPYICEASLIPTGYFKIHQSQN